MTQYTPESRYSLSPFKLFIMFPFLRDLVRYPWDYRNPQNKAGCLFQFLFKEYPAFLRNNPQLKKVIIFPFILIAKLFDTSKVPQDTIDKDGSNHAS